MQNERYLEDIRNNVELSFRDMLGLIIRLSIPGILAQLSSVMMSYIDASMVGRLGAEDSAAIGLVASSTWLVGGICVSVSVGFTVMAAQMMGAGDEQGARRIVKSGLVTALIFSSILGAVCCSISGMLPVWMGGQQSLLSRASSYFMICAMFQPVMQLNYMSAGFLQATGNMRIPSIIQVCMCLLDIVFNFFLIFPGRTMMILGREIYVYGADMGVAGAALGTAMARIVSLIAAFYFLLFRSEALRFRRGESLPIVPEDIKRAFSISWPVAIEQMVMSGGQVAFTRLVSPLGSISLAANSFAITAESLCYMPGFGISSAGQALIGQSVGAGRKRLTEKLGRVIAGFGFGIMALVGVLLYIFAPQMIGIITKDPQVVELGARVLRIEALAEPFYGMSIVLAGVFRGAGRTLRTTIINFISMWIIRIPLVAFLVPLYGLQGAWRAMSTELMIRGILYFLMLMRGVWPKNKEAKDIIQP